MGGKGGISTGAMVVFVFLGMCVLWLVIFVCRKCDVLVDGWLDDVMRCAGGVRLCVAVCSCSVECRRLVESGTQLLASSGKWLLRFFV